MSETNTKFIELRAAMSAHGLKDYPREACGLILTDFSYIPCKNISGKPRNSFIIDPFAIQEHEDNIWGFFHSHPGAENPLPSEDDFKSTIFSDYKFIVGFGGNFYIYWLENNTLRYERFEERHCQV